MDKQRNTHEAQLMEALSMGMYGRPTQNRCRILNREQRERLRMAAMEMAKKNDTEVKENHPESKSQSTPG